MSKKKLNMNGKMVTISTGPKKKPIKFKKGGLHRQLGVPEGQKIPASKMSAARKKAKKSPNSLLAKRLRLAKGLAKMRGKG
jgi:hypothetical protein